MSERRSEYQLLESIDASLKALVTIALDDYVRSHGISGAKPKSIDVMLHDVGLSTAEIASLLGKGQRAVQMATAKRAASTKQTSKKSAVKKSAPKKSAGRS